MFKILLLLLLVSSISFSDIRVNLENYPIINLENLQIDFYENGNVIKTGYLSSGNILENSNSYDEIVIYASTNNQISIGTGIDNTTNPITTGIYSYSLNKNSDEIYEIPSDNIHPFLMAGTLEQGKVFFQNLGYSFTNVTRVNYPNSTTEFKPNDALIFFSENDKYDIDVFLHEFGHYCIFNLSIDFSNGGFHSYQSDYDVRQSWSEGVATWISSEIQGDSIYTDKNSTGTSTVIEYDINALDSSALYITNEWAVSYLLWKAARRTSFKDVMDTINSIKYIFNLDNNEESNMDQFHDQWNDLVGIDIQEYYNDQKFGYISDNVSGNTINFPYELGLNKITDLTLYPLNDEDYFTFTASANVSYELIASNMRNGALVKMELYDGINVVSSANVDADNKYFATTTIEVTPTTDTTYIAKLTRFNSKDENYGLGEDDNYAVTSGTYGTYDFEIREKSSVSISSASSGGGGGGGCLLK